MEGQLKLQECRRVDEVLHTYIHREYRLAACRGDSPGLRVDTGGL